MLAIEINQMVLGFDLESEINHGEVYEDQQHLIYSDNK